MKRLYFVRHGLSEANLASKWAGSTETPLSAKGKAQAKATGKKAQQLGITHIVSSPLSRAHETAAIIAEQIGFPKDKIELHDLLVERHFGEMEGKPWSDRQNVEAFKDIEPKEAVLERAKQVYEYLKGLEAEAVLVTSHGAFGRALRHVIDPSIPFAQGHPETRLPFGEIVQFV